MSNLKYKEQMLKTLDCDKYFNVNKMKTFQNAYNFFIIIGARGLGKTTQCKIDGVDDWCENENEFIYARRWGNETSPQKELLNDVLSNVVFFGDGIKGGEYFIDKKRIAHLLAVSNQAKYKSKVFDKVKTMIYDEAIIRRSATNRYIDNEVECLLELISTVFRERTDYRVIILGNNADFFNPYTEYFHIPPLKPGQIYTDPDRKLYVEYAEDSKAYREANEKTPLYALTKGTPYHEYHYNNAVLQEKEVKYTKIPTNAKLTMRFLFDNYTLVMYYDNGYIYVKGLKERKNETPLIDLYRDGIPNYDMLPLMKKFPYYVAIRRAYYSETLRYANDVGYALVQRIVEMVK